MTRRTPADPELRRVLDAALAARRKARKHTTKAAARAREAVALIRQAAAMGASRAVIGAALGVSRQRVHALLTRNAPAPKGEGIPVTRDTGAENANA
jgi:hypothetical protein